MNTFHLLISYFTAGGILMAPIFFVSLVAWYVAVGKFTWLAQFRGFRKKYLKKYRAIRKGEYNFEPVGYYPYDELLLEIAGEYRNDGESRDFTILFKEFLIAAIPQINEKLPTISSWTKVAPLLGLLGTVSGMITTFKVITDYGLGNPNLTAQGISIALLTTQAGLTVAFPMVIFHNYLVGRARRITDKILLDGEELVNRVSDLKENRNV